MVLYFLLFFLCNFSSLDFYFNDFNMRRNSRRRKVDVSKFLHLENGDQTDWIVEDSRSASFSFLSFFFFAFLLRKYVYGLG